MSNSQLPRRDFFCTAARGAAATLLGSVSILLGKRASSKSAQTFGDVCSGNGHCRNCGVLPHCGHPNGRSARRVLGRHKEEQG